MSDFLTTAVLQALAQLHTFAYAQMQPDGLVETCSPNLADLLGVTNSELEGQMITAVLPELIGSEVELLAVFNHQQPVYHLPYVNHVQNDGSIRYLTIQVTAVAPYGLLLLVEDRTVNGRLQQALEQARNELHLLRQQVYKETSCPSS